MEFFGGVAWGRGQGTVYENLVAITIRIRIQGFWIQITTQIQEFLSLRCR